MSDLDGNRTRQDLKQLQSLPLSLKVSLTKDRIRQWIQAYGEDGVYVSFSGGKDSTVLLHIVREEYPNIKAAFADTGLEYPEIREFVKRFDNVDWIKPKMTFKKVISEYGYPFISKEVSFAVDGARRFLDNKQKYANKKPLPVQNPDEEYKPYALLRLEGKIGETGKGYSQFNCKRWLFLLDAPWRFSSRCCNVMKKEPFRKYTEQTGRHPITAQMASESRLRMKNWLLHGCNAFDANKPISNPMSFWTEQDVFQYIKKYNLDIASVYGDVISVDKDGMEYSCVIDPSCNELKTTGLDRTGCMFCAYGCHLDKPGEGRFELMKHTHPKQYEYIMKPWDKGGLGYKDVINWLNEHGGLNIRY